MSKLIKEWLGFIPINEYFHKSMESKDQMISMIHIQKGKQTVFC